MQKNLDMLAQQIRFDPEAAVQTGVCEFGVKCNQTIRIAGLNGNEIDVVFAWMRSATNDVVRLVTATPTDR